MTRTPDWIASNAVRTPGRVATVDLHTGRRLTYQETSARVDRLTQHLQSEWAVRPEDRVALLAHNSVDCFEIFFACRRAGAIFVPLNWRLAEPELSAILADMRPRVVLYDTEFGPAVRSATPPDGAMLVDREAGQAYERICTAPDPAVTHYSAAGTQVAAILYTSGTSGRPKGVLVTDEMLHANALNISVPAAITSSAVTLVVLPTFHAGGFNLYATPTLYAGGTIVVQRRFDPGQALALLSEESSGITHFFGVPTNYLAMSELPAFAQARFGHLTTLGVGGAPPSPALLRTYRAHDATLCNGYGMTETGPVVLTTGHDVHPLADGDVGRPVRHVEVRLDGDDSVRGAGRSGELLVRGPAVSPGYWSGSADEWSREPGAWFRTGDVVRSDDDGRYYIVDRAKNMYISGGENVYPAEVENVLLELPGIAETVIVGIPDQRWGEVGVAAVVLRPGARLTPADIIAHCARHVAAYKVPRQIVMLDEFPHNSTGKIARTEVRRLLQERPPAGRAGSEGLATAAPTS